MLPGWSEERTLNVALAGDVPAEVTVTVTGDIDHDNPGLADLLIMSIPPGFGGFDEYGQQRRISDLIPEDYGDGSQGWVVGMDLGTLEPGDEVAIPLTFEVMPSYAEPGEDPVWPASDAVAFEVVVNAEQARDWQG